MRGIANVVSNPHRVSIARQRAAAHLNVVSIGSDLHPRSPLRRCDADGSVTPFLVGRRSILPEATDVYVADAQLWRDAR